MFVVEFVFVGLGGLVYACVGLYGSACVWCSWRPLTLASLLLTIYLQLLRATSAVDPVLWSCRKLAETCLKE